LAGGPNPSSRRTSYPPKASSIAAVPRHRGRCPLAVGRRSCSAPRPTPLPAPSSELHAIGASTSRRCSAVESGHPTTVADDLASCPSMGFVPLRGPSKRTRHSCHRAFPLPTTKIRRKACVSATSSVPHPQRPYAADPSRPPCGSGTRG
jgi:hypothetical protein